MKPLGLALLLASCAPATTVATAPTRATTTTQGGGHGSKSYECKSRAGCTVRVNGSKELVGYGHYAPVACGPGIIVVGCGCGYEVPASCSCGETFEPLPSCAPSSCGSSPTPPSCSAASCGSAPSCDSSCGSGCGSG